MSFIAGLIAGLLIAAIQVALAHYGPSFGQFSLSGNGALAAPVILIPVALFWGWTWIGNRWSGRSDLPAILYTFALGLGVGAAQPIDAAVYTQTQSAIVGSLTGLVLVGLLFVLAPAVVGAIIYWAFRSGRVPTNALTLLIGYLIGLPLALPSIVPLPVPLLTMGIVAGTAAGHAWRSNARLLIAIWVILLMAFVVFGIPYLIVNGLKIPPLPGA